MQRSPELPPLREFLRWTAEMPASFRLEPEGFPEGRVRVRAVVADLFETLFGKAPPEDFLTAFAPGEFSKVERNRLRWILATAHLLWHPALRAAPFSRPRLEWLLVHEIATVATIVAIEEFDRDEERREELVRRVLRVLGLRLPGESPNEAEDRFRQVDSVERRGVLEAAAAREKRARQVREAMAKKAAEEAAAKVARE